MGITNNTVAQDVFCRFEYNSGVHYGKVENTQVIPLDKAPWENGKPTGPTIGLKDVKLLCPSEPKVILGIGKPFSKNMDPDRPYKTVRWFVKPPSAAGSPGEKIVLPSLIDKVKVEVELVIVIGKKVKNADVNEAQDAIFGYTLGNDVVGDVNSFHNRENEPADQPESLLAPGLKISDNFAPFGPFIHTSIEWKGHEKELIITGKNGKEVAHYLENTSDMAYPPAKIVSDLSKILTLSPGDVIFSGTAKSFMAKPGDRVTIAIDGIGTCTNEIEKN